MADADFTHDGVTLRLSKEEWWFVTSAMSYVLHGNRLADHDFRNILMMDSADAERLHEDLGEAAPGADVWAPLEPATDVERSDERCSCREEGSAFMPRTVKAHGHADERALIPSHACAPGRAESRTIQPSSCQASAFSEAELLPRLRLSRPSR